MIQHTLYSALRVVKVGSVILRFLPCHKTLNHVRRFNRLVCRQESNIPGPVSRAEDLFPRGVLDKSRTCER